MSRALKLLSLASLIGTVLPSVLFYSGKWDLDIVKRAMLFSAIVWFVVTPFWMAHGK